MTEKKNDDDEREDISLFESDPETFGRWRFQLFRETPTIKVKEDERSIVAVCVEDDEDEDDDTNTNRNHTSHPSKRKRRPPIVSSITRVRPLLDDIDDSNYNNEKSSRNSRHRKTRHRDFSRFFLTFVTILYVLNNMSNILPLRCQRISCDCLLSETNTKCVHHTQPPQFRVGEKLWPCCNKRAKISTRF